MNRREFLAFGAAIALAPRTAASAASRAPLALVTADLESRLVVDVRVPARPRLVRTFRPPFLAHDVAWSPDGRHVWVTSGERVEVAIYDVRTARVARVISADAAPQHVTFAGDMAYVSSGWSG